jgi:tRNA1Val (adenine37-N6)-methyltransferase
VLLAACVPARNAEFVIEGGCGAGAGLLCLAARVSGIRGLGVERDAEIAGVARRNVGANGFTGIEVEAADVTLAEFPLADHSFANPPYYMAAGTQPPDRMRAAAKHAAPRLVSAWVHALAAPLRRRGTLTLILAAAAVAEAIAAMDAVDCRAAALLPFWPKEGRSAKLVVVQGVRHGRASFRVLPGIVLHQADGRFTPEAEAVMRNGVCLSLGELPGRHDLR